MALQLPPPLIENYKTCADFIEVL